MLICVPRGAPTAPARRIAALPQAREPGRAPYLRDRLRGGGLTDVMELPPCGVVAGRDHPDSIARVIGFSGRVARLQQQATSPSRGTARPFAPAKVAAADRGLDGPGRVLRRVRRRPERSRHLPLSPALWEPARCDPPVPGPLVAALPPHPARRPAVRLRLPSPAESRWRAFVSSLA